MIRNFSTHLQGPIPSIRRLYSISKIGKKSSMGRGRKRAWPWATHSQPLDQNGPKCISRE